MKNENDLRVIKTQKNIRSALISLMEEKPMPEISVKDICDRALCSRNTFYMHFPYKEAVLEQITKECMDEVLKGTERIVDSVHQLTPKVVEQYSRNLIEAAESERETILFLLRHDSGNTFSRMLSDAIYASFFQGSEEFATKAAAAEPEYQLYLRYLTAGIVNFILHWLQCPDISKDEASRILHAIHSGPIRTSLHFLQTHAKRQR